MIERSKVLELIIEPIKERGLFIVSLEISTLNKITLLIDSMVNVTVNDCVKLSRTIESGLDREKEDFELEVSSPGLDLPFKVVQQYKKNIGNDVEAYLINGICLKGKILSADDKGFEIEEYKKVKIEGKKKQEIILDKKYFSYNEINKVRKLIKF